MGSGKWNPKYQYFKKASVDLWFSNRLISFWLCLFVIKLYPVMIFSKHIHISFHLWNMVSKIYFVSSMVMKNRPV